MTFWIDDHLHPELADWLGSQYKIIAKSLKEIGLHGAKDPVLIAAARRFGNIVMITKDGDFAEAVERLGPPPQVVWLSIGNCTKHEVQVILRKGFAQALQQIEAGAPIVEISR